MVISFQQKSVKSVESVVKKIKCMKLFKKNFSAEKIGNFILTVITAFVSTFLMQSCMNL